MAIPPAPVIEGVLKSTINSIAFGAITTVLAVTFGRFFIPNFFVVIVSFVVFIEVVLLVFIPKRKEEYELYQAPSRRVTHNIGGADVPQINVQDTADGTPKKRHGIRDRLKKDGKHVGKKDQLDPNNADNPDGASSSLKRSASPKKSPKMERKTKEGEESKATQGSGQSVEQQEEKGKGKGKGGWRKRLASKSQSEEST